MRAEPETRPCLRGLNQAMSNLSRFITLFQAATKSVTNFAWPSQLP